MRKFHSQKSPLAKRGFPCKTISQPKGPCCKTSLPLRNHFAATSPPPTKFFAVVKHLSGAHVPFRGCEMSCETLQSQISLPQAFPPKNFAATKPPLGTCVPFRSPPNPFRSYKMSCETPCEHPIWLRNGPPLAKIPTII